MIVNAQVVAGLLGGEAINSVSILAPGPGHSRSDRSLSIKIVPGASDGFILHSFAGDSPTACLDHVRAALRLTDRRTLTNRHQPAAPAKSISHIASHLPDRSAHALLLWNQADDPRGTVVTNYLNSRGLRLPDEVAGDVVRFHPRLKFNGGVFCAMVALFRDVKTNTPCGIHRTLLDSTGRKLGRAMLGRAKHAAIKIDHDENVSLGLTIGEGLETCLAAYLAGFRPVWAAGSAGGIANFPVLVGAEALTILREIGDGGANHRATDTCVARWIAAGHEALTVTPLTGDDLNDVWCEVAR